MKKIVTSILICFLVASLLHSKRHAFRTKTPQQDTQVAENLPIVKFRRNLARKMNRHRPRKVFTKKPSLKKSIVIFSSTGGGGHGSVSYGLTRYLGDKYDITVLNALQSVLAPMDTLGTVTFGKVCGEDLYNFFLRCGWTNLLKSYAVNGSKIVSWRHDMLVRLMLDYFSQVKPDLIISVIPIFNGVFLEACERLDIPFLIPTNDLDTTNYIVGLKPPYFKKFIYTLPFDDPEIWKKIEPAQIPKDQVVISGFPLRPEFFTPKNVPKLKKKFKIPLNKPVVMVFMGGAGSQASYRYVRNLARLGIPLHIIVCLGRNERLARNIKKILLPDEVTISIFGFTRRIADLMAISDVLITKPGPNSTCEALASLVPMILDMTHGTLFWEQLNIDFMVKHGFAEKLDDYSQLSTILPKYFENSAFTDSVKQKMRSFKYPRFNKTIGPLVDSMIAMNKPKNATPVAAQA